MTYTLIALLVLATIFNYLNGMHDSSNIVATMISSRAFSPRSALGITAVVHFIAPFLFGVAVAKTIGEGIVDPAVINMGVILAALVSAIIWNIVTWYLGFPSSSSHALIGGIIGAVLIAEGMGAINTAGVLKVFLILFFSPVIGLLVGYLMMKIILFLARWATPRINMFFKRGQFFTAIALAFSHGTNDAQKTMGIITMGLVTAGVLESFVVPTWVILLSAAAMALGTATGGWRLIRTLGGKFYRIKPVDGFASQLASSTVILSASVLGGPVSTTQVVSSSIMGVGAAERINKVRWGVGGEILTTWVVTIPLTGLVAAGIYWLLILIFPSLSIVIG